MFHASPRRKSRGAETGEARDFRRGQTGGWVGNGSGPPARPVAAALDYRTSSEYLGTACAPGRGAARDFRRGLAGAAMLCGNDWTERSIE